MNGPDEMKILLSAFLLAFVVSPFLAPRATASLSGSVVRVPYDFPTIQEGVNAAPVGGVVLAASGTYSEHLAINKSISLLGEERTTTVIIGDMFIEADNVQVNGFTVTNGSHGIYLNQTNNCVIENDIVAWQYSGVLLRHSNCTTISNNLMTMCGGHDVLSVGGPVGLDSSYNNTLEGNVMISNGASGLGMYQSSYNVVRDNVLVGVYDYVAMLDSSNNNTIYRNAFVAVEGSIDLLQAYNNSWKDMGRGNFWDGYTGIDDGSGGRVAGDGVGDTELPVAGVDDCPLVCPPVPVPFMVGNVTYLVGFSSNSTISTIRLVETDKKIVFNMAGPNGTSGYCNLTIPKDFLRGGWKVTLDAADISSLSTITENETHTFVQFQCDFSSRSIQVMGTWIVPESPSIFTLLFLMISSMTSCILVKRKRRMPRAC